MTYFDLSKQNLIQCTESVRILTAVSTDAIKWRCGQPASKTLNTRLSH